LHIAGDHADDLGHLQNALHRLDVLRRNRDGIRIAAAHAAQQRSEGFLFKGLLINEHRRIRGRCAGFGRLVAEQLVQADLFVRGLLAIRDLGGIRRRAYFSRQTLTFRAQHFIDIVEHRTDDIRLFNQLELEQRRGADDFFSALNVLNARQLNDDALAALFLNGGFRNAELIDAVAQHFQRAVDRVFGLYREFFQYLLIRLAATAEIAVEFDITIAKVAFQGAEKITAVFILFLRGF